MALLQMWRGVWRAALRRRAGHPALPARIVSIALLLALGPLVVACQSQGGALGKAPAATATPAPPTPTPIPFERPEVEAGVAFPQWNTAAYGAKDSAWRAGLLTLQQQTGARWVSIVVDLYQDGYQATTIHPGSGTPTPQSLAEGIAYAHHLGLKVFVEPLLNVLNVPAGQDWSGLIAFDSSTQAQAWFDGYWAGYEPYVRAAQQAGADQLGIGTELQALEQQPASLWNTLISRERSVFTGKLTYDINWNSLSKPIPSWLRNPALDYIGVSEYMPVAQNPQSLSVDQIGAIWSASLLPVYDHFSKVTGKPLIFSEIGYRNATDALYRPWDHSTTAPADPALQAAAYTAAAQAVFRDKHIVGLFFWAWDNGIFAPSPTTAAALKAQYLSTAA